MGTIPMRGSLRITFDDRGHAVNMDARGQGALRFMDALMNRPRPLTAGQAEALVTKLLGAPSDRESACAEIVSRLCGKTPPKAAAAPGGGTESPDAP